MRSKSSTSSKSSQSSVSESEIPQDVVPPHPACILGPKDHPITSAMIDRDALYVLKKLSDAGFAGYLVGGGVRDLYLGKTPKDFDISTDARPGQLRKLFPNSNTIGRRFRLVQVFFRGGKTIEISTLRSLSEHDLDGPETVLAPNNTFGTLSEDARRRDLTINSLFYEIGSETIIDYVEGSKDLDRGIIRIVGEPEKRIGRDPVRMLRAIRHAARINFTIEEQTWQAICNNSHKLSLCPPSRLRDEFLKDLYGGAVAPWFELAVDSLLLFCLFPLYRKILIEKPKDSNSAQSPREQLSQICQTIDRANQLSLEYGVHRQSDYFLIGLFLIPWAETKFQILSQFRKGGPLFQVGKRIRAEIDQSLAVELNLRRSLRQEMVSLLINLSQLIHNRQQNDWPKWLKKKSYFNKACLFYHYYMSASNGTDIEPFIAELLRRQPAQQEATYTNQAKHADHVSHKSHSSSAKKSKPAFSTNNKGGIFGFKK